MAIDATARADTFPKLLIRNARVFATRPAYPAQGPRHLAGLDLGAGAGRGARLCGRAVAGSASSAATPSPSSARNRPRLYWSVMAAQALGAVPVPVYADAVAEEMAYVLAHAEVRFAVGRGPGAGRQDPVGLGAAAEARADRLRRAARPARLRPRPAACDRRRASQDGRAALARDADARRVARPRDRGRQGLRPVDHPLHVGHDRPVQGRGALRAIGCISAASDTVAFDKLTERDEALAYLPLAWVGDHYLNYAQAWSPASASLARRAPRP